MAIHRLRPSTILTSSETSVGLHRRTLDSQRSPKVDFLPLVHKAAGGSGKSEKEPHSILYFMSSANGRQFKANWALNLIGWEVARGSWTMSESQLAQ